MDEKKEKDDGTMLSELVRQGTVRVEVEQADGLFGPDYTATAVATHPLGIGGWLGDKVERLSGQPSGTREAALASLNAEIEKMAAAMRERAEADGMEGC